MANGELHEMVTSERLCEMAVELVSRPDHETVRALVHELLVGGLGAIRTEVRFEQPVPEVRGRIDALLGRTMFEFKSNLRRETPDAEEQLTRYLGDREAQTGEHFVGISTDGASFVAYDLRRQKFRFLDEYKPSADDPRDLLAWLSSAVSVSADGGREAMGEPWSRHDELSGTTRLLRKSRRAVSGGAPAGYMEQSRNAPGGSRS